MHETWKATLRVGAEGIAQTQAALTQVAKMGASDETIQATVRMLAAKEQLFEALLHAYLLRLRDGADRD